MPKIRLDNLVKRYGDVEVLYGIELEMADNEFTILVGPSGCGKSTTLQRRGMAIDTYQAIWGTDPAHPGNQLPHPGWGVRRWQKTEEEEDVRSDRGNGIRSH